MRKRAYTKLGDFRVEIGNGKGLRFVGFGLDFGGYEGDELQIALYLGVVHIWLTYSARWVARTLNKVSKMLGYKYGRSFNSHVHVGRALSIVLFGDHTDDEAAWRYYLDIPRLIKGKAKVTYETISEGETVIVMPEKRYAATYRVQRLTWHYPRWWRQSRVDIDLKVPEGIPHEGKGENSYDCGMDYTYGLSTTYKDSVRQACDELALIVIKDRQRHSSLDQYANVPSGLPADKRGIVAGAEMAA